MRPAAVMAGRHSQRAAVRMRAEARFREELRSCTVGERGHDVLIDRAALEAAC
ncbi:MAG: hypothetical protein ACREFP_07635 [Acetobacteraceae bacterium]